MEVGGVLGHVGQRVVDLVIQDHRLVGDIGQRDAAALAERHLPVAVERGAGIDADRQRGDLGVLLPAAGEEVADRALHRGLLLVVPVNAQDRSSASGRSGSSRSAGSRPARRCRRWCASSPGAILMEGESFQPTPRSRAQPAPVPSVAMPASALSRRRSSPARSSASAPTTGGKDCPGAAPGR